MNHQNCKSKSTWSKPNLNYVQWYTNLFHFSISYIAQNYQLDIHRKWSNCMHSVDKCICLLLLSPNSNQIRSYNVDISRFNHHLLNTCVLLLQLLAAICHFDIFRYKSCILRRQKRTTPSWMWFSFMAEKEGFEPSIPFWGIHDFQSCALGQLRDFSMLRPLLQSARVYYSIWFDLSILIFSFFAIYFHSRSKYDLRSVCDELRHRKTVDRVPKNGYNNWA